MTTMVVVRGPRDRHFTQISNTTLRTRIPPDALGVLCFLLSHEDGFRISTGGLATHFQVGRDRMQRIVRDLKDTGHLELVQTRDDKGRVGEGFYRITEAPVGLAGNPQKTGGERGSPGYGLPGYGLPGYREIPPHKNMESFKNTESQEESPLAPQGAEPGLFEPEPKRKRATSIPPGFGDTGVGPGVRFVDLYADAQQAGLDGMALVASELQKFRDYHTAKGSTFKDWRAAWRNWCRNAVEFSKRDGRKPRRDAGVMEQGAMTYEQMVAKGMTQEDMKRVVGNKGYVP